MAEITGLFVCYNWVAFGLQLPLGLGLIAGAYKPGGRGRLGPDGPGGCPLSLPRLFGAVVVGLGNALFHVGAGAIVLTIAKAGQPRRESSWPPAPWA